MEIETYMIKENGKTGQRYIVLPSSSSFKAGDRVDLYPNVEL